MEDHQVPYDFNELNEVIVEYFKHLEAEQGPASIGQRANFAKVIETFQKEAKEKQGQNIIGPLSDFQLNHVPQSKTAEGFPTLYKAFIEEKDYETRADETEELRGNTEAARPLSKKEEHISAEITATQQQHSSVLQSARQIFSIAINCLQQLHNIKDGNMIQDAEQLTDTIDNYKIQLDKYDKIIRTEGRADKAKLFSENVMNEHRNRLIQAQVDGNMEGVAESLLSLRVNALQISPELRKNLVYELIRNDIFLLQANLKDQMLLSLLAYDIPQLQHSVLSLVSIVASTLKGVDYLMTNGKEILLRIFAVSKGLAQQEIEQPNPITSVNLRFTIAILQKMSIKTSLVALFVENDMINFVLSCLEAHYKAYKPGDSSPTKEKKIRPGKLHIFFLDFSTAMLANILHSRNCQEWLAANEEESIRIANRLLLCLKVPKKAIPPSVMMHVLICLSYFNKTKAVQAYVEGPACQFSDKISKFVEEFSKLPTKTKQGGIEDENADIDKRTILDLCAHIFHPTKQQEEAETTRDEFIMSYEAGEFNDMRVEDRIKEFENEQGDLIFECFMEEAQLFG